MHFVDEEYDRGPIIAQRTVAVTPGDSAEVVAKRVLEQARSGAASARRRALSAFRGCQHSEAVSTQRRSQRSKALLARRARLPGGACWEAQAGRRTAPVLLWVCAEGPCSCSAAGMPLAAARCRGACVWVCLAPYLTLCACSRHYSAVGPCSLRIGGLRPSMALSGAPEAQRCRRRSGARCQITR